MKCSICKIQVENLKAKVINNKIIEGCDKCMTRQENALFSARYNRESMKRNHRKDLVQRYDFDGKPNDEFIKAYPDKAEKYFTKQELEQSNA